MFECRDLYNKSMKRVFNNEERISKLHWIALLYIIMLWIYFTFYEDTDFNRMFNIYMA